MLLIRSFPARPQNHDSNYIDLTGISSDDEPPTKKPRIEELVRWDAPLQPAGPGHLSNSSSSPNRPKSRGSLSNSSRLNRPSPRISQAQQSPSTTNAKSSEGRTDFLELLKDSEPGKSKEGRVDIDDLLSEAEAEKHSSPSIIGAAERHFHFQKASIEGKTTPPVRPLSRGPPRADFQDVRSTKAPVPAAASGSVHKTGQPTAIYKPKPQVTSQISNKPSNKPIYVEDDVYVRKPANLANSVAQSGSPARPTTIRTQNHEIIIIPKREDLISSALGKPPPLGTFSIPSSAANLAQSRKREPEPKYEPGPRHELGPKHKPGPKVDDDIERKIGLVLKAFHQRALPIQSKILPPKLTSPHKDRACGLQHTRPTLLQNGSSGPPKRRGRPPLNRDEVLIAPVAWTTNSVVGSLTPNFDRSTIPTINKNAGESKAYTPADCILLLYLREVRGLTDSQVDTMLGRDYYRLEGLPKASSSPCGVKWCTQLKKSEFKARLDWKYNLVALREILKLDLPILQTRDLLTVFMDNGNLPPGLSLPDIKTQPIHYEQADASVQTLPQVPRQSVHQYGEYAAPDYSQSQFRNKQGQSRQRPSYVNFFPDSSTLNLDNGTDSKLNDSLQNSDVDLLGNTVMRPRRHTNYSPSAEVESRGISPMHRSPWKVSERRKTPKRKVTLPYLSKAERQNVPEAMRHLDWESMPHNFISEQLHSNFDTKEIDIVLKSAQHLRPGHVTTGYDSSLAIQIALHGLRSTSEVLARIIAKASEDLPERTLQSIRSFCLDIINNEYEETKPSISVKPQPKRILLRKPMVLNRELGGHMRKEKVKLLGELIPSRSFNEMSGDVDFLAFSPQGDHFAASGCCLTDNDNMQYNNAMNLVIGNLASNTITELADHWTPRPRTKKGANSTDLMRNSQDSRLFHTVPMIQFSGDGKYLYSVGYDGKLNSYNVSNRHSRMTADLQQPVGLLSTSHYHNLVATGARKLHSSISIFQQTSYSLQPVLDYESGKAIEKFGHKIYPSCLKWGHAFYPNILTAGFSSSRGEETGERDLQGEICIWDVMRNKPLSLGAHAGSVFDISWSPIKPIFAAALANTAAGGNKWAKSHVRVFYDKSDVWNRNVEFDCTARDINDVVFCPYDDNYIAAGTTNGDIHVFDQRRPDQTLHVLSHDKPLAKAPDEYAKREDWDSGVRFCFWGASRDMLITGSSDGVVKTWDIFRGGNPHVSDLVTLNSGITSASFSPDFTSLVIGEINRTVTVLEIGSKKKALRNLDHFKFVRAKDATVSNPDMDIEMTESTNSGAHTSSACHLPRCRDNEKVATELVDSERHKDRIPHDLMAALSLSDDEDHEIRDSNKTMLPMAMKKCQECGRPCRPREGEQETHPLCEGCGFSCFRCGERLELALPLKTVNCRPCNKIWEIGALGYHLLGDDVARKGRKSPDANGVIDIDGAEDPLFFSEVVENDHSEVYCNMWSDQKND